MGWCSGTEIFDKVAEYVLGCTAVSEAERTNIIRVLIDALEDHDWDCQDDSDLMNDPIVKEVMRELHPEWYDIEGDGY